MPAVSTKVAQPKKQARSRVGNGSDLFAGVDGRSSGMRRYREVLANLLADLPGSPSESQTITAKRAASLTVFCESVEAAQANGSDFDIGAYVTGTNTLRRLLADLGVQAKVEREVNETERFMQTVLDGMGLDIRAVCAGPVEARRSAARRVAFGIAESQRTGEPITPELASLAIEVALAAGADLRPEAEVEQQPTEITPLPSPADFVENLKRPGEYDEFDVSKLKVVHDLAPSKAEAADTSSEPDLFAIGKLRGVL